jgi:hypothetical protein
MSLFKNAPSWSERLLVLACSLSVSAALLAANLSLVERTAAQAPGAAVTHPAEIG